MDTPKSQEEDYTELSSATMEGFDRLILLRSLMADPRELSEIEEFIIGQRDNFHSHSTIEQAAISSTGYDTHIYTDSGLVYSPTPLDKVDMSKILVGIDTDRTDIFEVAEHLNVNAIVSHHPEGDNLTRYMEQVRLKEAVHRLIILRGWKESHPEYLENEAVKELKVKELKGQLDSNIGKKINSMIRRIDIVNKEITRSGAINYGNMPLYGAHTVADNLVCMYLQDLIDKAQSAALEKKRSFTTDDLVRLLLTNVPEYAINYPQSTVGYYGRDSEGKEIVDPSGKVKKISNEKGGKEEKVYMNREIHGQIFVDMTGATSGTKEFYELLAEAGVRTVVAMHENEDEVKAAKEYGIRIINVGHHSSDSLGMNLLFEAVGYEGDIYKSDAFVRVSPEMRKKFITRVADLRLDEEVDEQEHLDRARQYGEICEEFRHMSKDKREPVHYRPIEGFSFVNQLYKRTEEEVIAFMDKIRVRFKNKGLSYKRQREKQQTISS